jgi:mannose-6-phosphate isomerase
LGLGHAVMSALQNPLPMVPLRFAPIFQYRLWGGRRLAEVFDAPLPIDGPVGEAWILSDRDNYASRVADGPLEGRTLRQLLKESADQILGTYARNVRRFPLLLKFLDAEQMLSVQVHPSDAHPELLPAGETGKTEAWVVLEAEEQSRIYAGLKPGATLDTLRGAVTDGTVADGISSFTPKPGDAVFLPSGTVHSLGGGVVVFEIQQNSDVTFRLYDWNHVDAKTGQPRALQVDAALSCTDFANGPVHPVTPLVEDTVPRRERLFRCEQFSLWRVRSDAPFGVGAVGAARVLVCIEGAGHVEHPGTGYPVGRGETILLPAVLGPCVFRPERMVTLLEIALPESGVISVDRERRR